MPASARWLMPAVAVLIASTSGLYALSRWHYPEPVPSRASGGFDVAAVLDGWSDERFDQLAGAWKLVLPADHGARTWSDGAGVPYPVDWRLRAGELQLKVAPIADDQVHDFVEPLWSGLVMGEGVLRDRRVSGHGTLLFMGGESL